MAKATYDPKATYEVVKGNPSVKEPKTNNRKILVPGDKTTLSHLQPHEIAFLVEVKGMYKLAGAAGGGKS